MTRCRFQSGAALLTALFATTAVMLIGASAAQTALNAEKTARNERDRHLAFQSAEAGLADAERDVADGARAALFAEGQASAFTQGCGQAGLCRFMPADATPAWQAADLADPAVSTAYGAFTGATLPGRSPRYIIELLTSDPVAGHLYRITAIGFGVRSNTQVVLQSIYRKTGAARLRVSWREIANWQELHDAAT